MANIYKKKLNLLEQYKIKLEEKKKVNSKEKSFTSTFCVIGALILVACVGIYILLSTTLAGKQAALDDINDQLQNPDIIAQNQVADNLLTYNTEIDSILRAIDKAGENIAALPNYKFLKATLFKDLKAVLGNDVSITSLTFESSQLNISLKTTKANKVSAFVAALEQKQIFKSVEYVGFTGGTAEESDSEFTFELVCKF